MPGTDDAADFNYQDYVIVVSSTGQRRSVLKGQIKYLEPGEEAYDLLNNAWKPTADAAFKTLIENGYPDATKMPQDEFIRMRNLYEERERYRKGPAYYVIKVADFHEGIPVRPEDVRLVWPNDPEGARYHG